MTRLTEIEERANSSASFGYSITHYRDDVNHLLSLLRSAEEALEMVRRNDKTVYDYGFNAKTARNANGDLPAKGTRFKTPLEIASEALSKIREKGTR